MVCSPLIGDKVISSAFQAFVLKAALQWLGFQIELTKDDEDDVGIECPGCLSLKPFSFWDTNMYSVGKPYSS